MCRTTGAARSAHPSRSSSIGNEVGWISSGVGSLEGLASHLSFPDDDVHHCFIEFLAHFLVGNPCGINNDSEGPKTVH
jgi:hypothetical protein